MKLHQLCVPSASVVATPIVGRRRFRQYEPCCTRHKFVTSRFTLERATYEAHTYTKIFCEEIMKSLRP